MLKPGDPYVTQFTTTDPSTGSAANASTAAATAYLNGTADAAFALTVTNLETGLYNVTGTIPAGYVNADIVSIQAEATVGTSTGKNIINTFVIEEDVTVDSASVTAISSAVSVAGSPTVYFPTSAVRTNGDNEGGTVSDLAAHDESYFVTGENPTTGIDVLVTLNASGTDLASSLVRVVGRYEGISAHHVEVYAYNYGTSGWDREGTMYHRTSDFEYVFPSNTHNFDTNGAAQIRFVHVTTTYIGIHALHLDFVSWEKIATTSQLSKDVAAVYNLLTEVDTDITTLDTNVDSILEDTGTTIPATISPLATAAALAAHDTKLDTVDTIADQILVDTGTSLPTTLATLATTAALSAHDTKLDTVDTNVDSILVDTGTSIPTSITAISAITAADVETAVANELLSYDAPTDAEMLAAFAALNDVSLAQVGTAVATELEGYGVASGTSVSSAVASLNNLGISQVETAIAQELATYDSPTDTEMLAAFAALNNISVDQVGTAISDAGLSSASDLAAHDAKLDIVDVNVDTILADTGTALPTTLATLATTAALAAHDAKLDIVDAIVDQILVDTGTSLPATLDTISGTGIGTELISVLTTYVMSELPVSAPSATPTMVEAIMLLYMALRNRRETTSNTDQIFNDAGTAIASAILSDDAVTVTKTQYSGP